MYLPRARARDAGRRCIFIKRFPAQSVELIPTDGSLVNGLERWSGVGSSGLHEVWWDGTGWEVTRARQTRLDVRDFGARGDDRDEDATRNADAINEALAQGGVVVLSGGVFPVDETLTLSVADTVLLAEGGSLRKAGTDFDLINVTANRCRIEKLFIDGDDQTEGSLIRISGDHNTVFGCRLTDNGVSTDAAAYANPSYGVEMVAGAIQNSVLNTRISFCHDAAVIVTGAEANQISNCDLHLNGREGVIATTAARRTLINNNHITDNCMAAGQASVLIDGSDVCSVVGNIVAGGNSTTVADGIKVTNATSAADFGFILITGNHVWDVEGWCIRVHAGATGSPDRCTITGNQVRSGTLGSIRLDANCDNNCVVGNIIAGVAVSDAGASNTVASND